MNAAGWARGLAAGLVSNRDEGAPNAVRAQPVSLVRWRSPTSDAQAFRVTLHPLRAPNAAAASGGAGTLPNPRGAIYSSEPAGGQMLTPVLLDVLRGQPLAGPAYVILRWGVGAYQTSLFADWPRQGGGFDVAGDNIEIDGLLTATSGPSLMFGAHLAPGNKSNPEAGTLMFTQQLNGDGVNTGTMNVPSYASRIRLSTNTTASVPGAWMTFDGTTVGPFSFSGTSPYVTLVPAAAAAVAFTAPAGALVQAIWSLSP